MSKKHLEEINKKLLVICIQRPRDPRWGGYWDASYYRPACPQRVHEIKRDVPDFPKANISEDCLYMNVFAPNVSLFIYKQFFLQIVSSMKKFLQNSHAKIVWT